MARRYFDMWNTGDVSIAPDILGADWIDHAHPEVRGPEDVQRAVAQTHAARPGLRFEIEAVLGEEDGELVSVVGGVGHESRPGVLDSRLIWLIRVVDGRLAEMWTYRPTQP
jgi:ketosteroid isomerase-like protein